jgi:cellulose synthase/poly-beta-1,6-N-acetylglucosamine synthase-like glycosyltransferase
MERFVERALLSAIGQTYPNLDILVIDDGSTDGTPDIVRRMADRHRNARLVCQANAGVAAARNRGTEMADSLYVAYLDADDLWHPLKIERQVAALAAHGHSAEWGSCYTLYRLIDPLDRVLDNGALSHERGDFFDEHLAWNPVGNGSNLLVRRDLALEVGGFDPDYARRGIGGCEDLEFQLKLLRVSRMEVVREFLLGYRIHPAQMSADSVRMRLSHIAVIETILAQTERPAPVHDRALIQAYTTAAKGFFLVREWRQAAKWLRACLAVSPLETARKAVVLGCHELGYWSLRLRLALRGGDASPPRPFDDFAPLEGVDGRSPDTVRYRSTLVGGAQARTDSRLKTDQPNPARDSHG